MGTFDDLDKFLCKEGGVRVFTTATLWSIFRTTAPTEADILKLRESLHKRHIALTPLANLTDFQGHVTLFKTNTVVGLLMKGVLEQEQKSIDSAIERMNQFQRDLYAISDIADKFVQLRTPYEPTRIKR